VRLLHREHPGPGRCLTRVSEKSKLLRVTRRAVVSLVSSLLFLGAGCGGDGDGGVTVGDPVAGKAVFEQQGCGNCHTFTAAGSTRNQGPNLDEVVRRYDAAFIRESIVDPEAYVEKGAGGSIGSDKIYRDIMPAFGPNPETEQNRLTDQQIADLIGFLTQGQ
jgi:mono/diheme cytochrome c family protein